MTKNMIVNLCKTSGFLGLVFSEREDINFTSMMTKQYYQWVLLYLNGQKKRAKTIMIFTLSILLTK